MDGALSGWWAKAHIFRAKELGFSGRVMYIDLDMVITGDLMNLFRYDGVNNFKIFEFNLLRISLCYQLIRYIARQLRNKDTIHRL